MRGDGPLAPAIRCAQMPKRTNGPRDVVCGMQTLWQRPGRPKESLAGFVQNTGTAKVQCFVTVYHHICDKSQYGWARFHFCTGPYDGVVELDRTWTCCCPLVSPRTAPLQVVRVHRRRNLLPDRCGTEMMAVDMVVGAGMGT